MPGVSRGYVAPFLPFDDGFGERLYVGGSFDSVTGVPASRLLARWNPMNNTWSSVGAGLSTGFTNGFLTSLVVYDAGQGPELIAGGFMRRLGRPSTRRASHVGTDSDGRTWARGGTRTTAGRYGR